MRVLKKKISLLKGRVIKNSVNRKHSALTCDEGVSMIYAESESVPLVLSIP